MIVRILLIHDSRQFLQNCPQQLPQCESRLILKGSLLWWSKKSRNKESRWPTGRQGLGLRRWRCLCRGGSPGMWWPQAVLPPPNTEVIAFYCSCLFIWLNSWKLGKRVPRFWRSDWKACTEDTYVSVHPSLYASIPPLSLTKPIFIEHHCESLS